MDSLPADSRRVALDTNAVIYFLERRAPFDAFLDSLFEDVEAGRRTIVISVIAEAELKVKPMRDDNAEALRLVDLLLAMDGLEVVGVSREIANRAALIRARHYLSLPDAIIVATAITAGCDALIGNDRRCAERITDIPYVYLDEVTRQ